MNYITYDEFKKLDIRIGTIREIEPVEGTDKLLRCQIDFGVRKATAEVVAAETDSVLTDEELAKLDAADTMTESLEERDIRQIVSGIREYYPDYESLIGKQVLYVVNLEPREIRGQLMQEGLFGQKTVRSLELQAIVEFAQRGIPDFTTRHILGTDFSQRSDRLSQKMASRLARIQKELTQGKTQPYSVFGPEGLLSA
jgi:methionyl-tRNA synthetase